jgi:hypothetical protein
LNLFSAWTSSVAFKPALAILVVSLLTGLVGYRVLRQQPVSHSPTLEVAARRTVGKQAKSLGKRESDSLEADKIQQESKPAPNMAEPAEKPTRPKVPSFTSSNDAEKERSIPGDTPLADSRAKTQNENRRDALNRPFSPEPSAQPEPGNKTKDSFKTDGGDAGSPESSRFRSASPELKKEIEPKRDESAQQNSQLTQNAGSNAASGRLSESVGQAKPSVAAPLPPPAATLSSTAAEQKVRRDEAFESPQDRTETRKKAPAEKGPHATSARRIANRLTLGGKQFELRDRAWCDLSISAEEAGSPKELFVGTPDFEAHQNALVPFDELLSRPEDVLIKLPDGVYRIRKKR